MELRRNLGALSAPLRRVPPVTARMRPGYLIVGTKRGGSTSLADWLTMHPQVAPCRYGKGTRYFDVNYGRGLAWYLSRFEKPDDRWRITGEASPYYMYHPAAAGRIAEVLPEVKLIAVLREPVERAWSQYKYEVARGHETEPLERALDLEPRRLAGERERLMSDPGYEGYAFRHQGYLARGHYAEQLEHLYHYFPREQVLVLQSEQLFADPQGQLEQVWEFLGIEKIRLAGLEPRNANPGHQRMEPATLERLVDYYRPLNEQLYANPDVRFRWKEPSGRG